MTEAYLSYKLTKWAFACYIYWTTVDPTFSVNTYRKPYIRCMARDVSIVENWKSIPYNFSVVKYFSKMYLSRFLYLSKLTT